MKCSLLPVILILTLIATNIELDIYVPALPKMLDYFATTNSNLQWILSVNFFGVAIGSLFYGPLSDHFGRKKVMMLGLIIFVIGSLGCVLSNTLIELILWRLVQGLGSSGPAIVGFAAIAELYEEKKAAQLISIANSLITGSMAGAPVIGNYLTIQFNWRANFIFILFLAILSFIAVKIFFIEPKKHLSKEKFRIRNILKNYVALLKNKKLLFFGIIPSLMYASLIIYIANQSLLFVNYFGVRQQDIGYYQAVIMLVFLLFSFFAAILLNRFSVKISEKLGLYCTIIASSILLIVSFILPKTPIVINVVMSIFAAGSAFALGPFISQALNCCPEFRGTSSALLGAIRLLLSSCVITAAGFFFNGTLVPIAIIIFILMVMGIIMYLHIEHFHKHSASEQY